VTTISTRISGQLQSTQKIESSTKRVAMKVAYNSREAKKKDKHRKSKQPLDEVNKPPCTNIKVKV
jgi:hypothetical protein